MPPLAVAIVNYRTAHLVIAALPALLAELAPCEAALVVIVDNASGDGSAEALAAAIAANGWDARVRLLVSPRNGGFAAGNNLAFAEIARWEHDPLGILLLNPDAEVRPGAVRALVRGLAERPRAGAIGPCLEDPGGARWSAAFHFPSLAREAAAALNFGPVSRRFPITLPMQHAPRRADWVSGAAVLLRAEAVRDVGPMDEGFFLYFEEVDYMRRMQAAGWEVWHLPGASVLHDAGSATQVRDGLVRQGPMPAYWFASWLRYFAKAHGPLYARATALARMAALLLSYPLAALRGRRRGLPEGYLAGFARHCLFARLPRLGPDGRA